MSIVLHCLEDILRGEINKLKVPQAAVYLNLAGGYINWRLPILSAARIVVFPVLWGIFYEKCICC